MKLPLLLHATPRLLVGPTVMLPKGKWRFESNHKDSDIKIALNSDSLIPLPQELSLVDDSRVCVSVTNKGTEKELTIYAIES